MKPFEVRCNFIKAQGDLSLANRVDTCQNEAGDEVFNALLAMHTLFRVGMAQKQAWLSPADAKTYMIARLTQILPEWHDRDTSVLESADVYGDIWHDVEYPVNVVVRGMEILGGRPVPLERTMNYRCEIQNASTILGQMLSNPPTRDDMMRSTDYSYRTLSDRVQTFVHERNQLEGNAAQCCSSRN